ncbi:MAG: SDR family oxidoreductase, partial [bacterium]|nr:SDR family oxidoreductase [bacterium]
MLFLTGATGFLAKGLLEKTLRNAPEVKRIYLFIRPRGRAEKRISAAERLESEVFQSSAFARLRAEWGEAFDAFVHEKVEAVSGNLTEPRLGISPEMYERLLAEVDFVINYAGTVVFDEPLDLALKVNTLGPGRIAEFARDCRDAALVHVSTAYVNGQRTGSIPETLLPPGRTVAHILRNGQLPEFDLQAEIKSIQVFCNNIEEQSKSRPQQNVFRLQLERQNRGKRVTEYRTTHQQEALRQRW